MYWKNQEKIIFDIALFMLVVFQVSTFFVVKSGSDNPQHFMILLCLNLLFLSAMIPYAKWVWKTPSYKKAILQVVKHEFIILGLSILVIIAAIFIDSVQRHA